MSEKKQEFHGSDLEKVEAYYGIKKEDIIPFAGNVNRSEFLLCKEKYGFSY